MPRPLKSDKELVEGIMKRIDSQYLLSTKVCSEIADALQRELSDQIRGERREKILDEIRLWLEFKFSEALRKELESGL